MKKVFINPGHTPQNDIDAGRDWDVGATGNGLQENIVAKNVADLLEVELKKYGVDVVGNFQSMSLYAITYNANATAANVLVSIHCNSSENSSANGTETFYCQGSTTGKKIAEFVQQNLISQMKTFDRGVKDDTQTQHQRIHVLRASNMPAVLIELAFLSNANDAELLRNRQADFAKAIAKGLAEYFGVSQKISPDVVDKPADLTEKRFKNISDVPDWAKSTIQKLLNKKLLSDANNLDLSLDMVRIFVINDRAGLYE